jgi:hypothetical protein
VTPFTNIHAPNDGNRAYNSRVSKGIANTHSQRNYDQTWASLTITVQPRSPDLFAGVSFCGRRIGLCIQWFPWA